MIGTTKLRELLLERAPDPARAPHLSAASGLVQVRDTLYVVADDELQLGVFSASSNQPGTLFRLFDGKLPDKPKKRKTEKPDLETLTVLPPFAGFPYGALLALGSGSKPNRQSGALLALDRGGGIGAPPQTIDLGRFYNGLRPEIERLNIEGAAVRGEHLCLFQRGNKGAVNALIECDLANFLGGLAAEQAPLADDPVSIRHYDLGAIDGVPLCFTDGIALADGRLLFSAAAEDTENSVDDGACRGSAIGVIDAHGALAQIDLLDRAIKVEGVTAHVCAREAHLLLVTDGDDASMPAALLSARLPVK